MFDLIWKKAKTIKLIITPKISHLFIVRTKEKITWKHQQPKYNGGTCSSKGGRAKLLIGTQQLDFLGNCQCKLNFWVVYTEASHHQNSH